MEEEEFRVFAKHKKFENIAEQKVLLLNIKIVCDWKGRKDSRLIPLLTNIYFVWTVLLRGILVKSAKKQEQPSQLKWSSNTEICLLRYISRKQNFGKMILRASPPLPPAPPAAVGEGEGGFWWVGGGGARYPRPSAAAATFSVIW
jgi:hypothetical protein